MNIQSNVKCGFENYLTVILDVYSPSLLTDLSVDQSTILFNSTVRICFTWDNMIYK